MASAEVSRLPKERTRVASAPRQSIECALQLLCKFVVHMNVSMTVVTQAASHVGDTKGGEKGVKRA